MYDNCYIEDIFLNMYNKAYAEISSDSKFRYMLSRCWDKDKPFVNWVMLNPSTADAYKDDPTIRRCVSFSKSWGYGGIIVTNLFDFRATSPKDLKKEEFPCSLRILSVINWCANHSELIMAAWGNHGNHLNRDQEIKLFLGSNPNITQKIYCLGITKTGQPKHPLYVPLKTAPIIFNT